MATLSAPHDNGRVLGSGNEAQDPTPLCSRCPHSGGTASHCVRCLLVHGAGQRKGSAQHSVHCGRAKRPRGHRAELAGVHALASELSMPHALTHEGDTTACRMACDRYLTGALLAGRRSRFHPSSIHLALTLLSPPERRVANAWMWSARDRNGAGDAERSWIELVARWGGFFLYQGYVAWSVWPRNTAGDDGRAGECAEHRPDL